MQTYAIYQQTSYLCPYAGLTQYSVKFASAH